MCGWKGILIEPITRLYTLLDFVVHAKWMLFTRSSTVSTSHWANGKKVNEKRAVQWNLMMFSISFPAIEIQWPNSSVGALPKISSPIKIFVEIVIICAFVFEHGKEKIIRIKVQRPWLMIFISSFDFEFFDVDILARKWCKWYSQLQLVPDKE